MDNESTMPICKMGKQRPENLSCLWSDRQSRAWTWKAQPLPHLIGGSVGIGA